MTDLHTRFAEADTIEAPDLWPSIGERVIGSVAPHAEPLATYRPHGERFRRAMAIAAAITVTFAVVALLARAFRTPSPNEPAPPRPTSIFEGAYGKIVYADTTPGHERDRSPIVAVDPTTGRTTVVLETEVRTNTVAWSTDGDTLLLADGTVLRADGSESHVLPPGDVMRLSGGSFSPDGELVAYASSDGIFVGDPSGTTPSRRIVKRGYGAAWSPDGAEIAFVAQSNTKGWSIETVHPDGTGRRLVLSLERFGLVDTDPPLAWSPDGSRIAFSASHGCCAGRFFRVGVVDADGSNASLLTPENGSAYPVWSPDGSTIAFLRFRHLFTMAPDGTDVRRVPGRVSYMLPLVLTWNPGG